MRAILIGALVLCAGCTNAPQRGETVTRVAPAAPAVRAQAQDPLEALFWHCDYVATTRGMDATPVSECAAATRELRRVKFANSFNAMLAWWRENKSAEHERVRRSRQEQPL
jgi:hypothetical protein